jgi:hypothetical protein
MESIMWGWHFIVRPSDVKVKLSQAGLSSVASSINLVIFIFKFKSLYGFWGFISKCCQIYIKRCRFISLVSPLSEHMSISLWPMVLYIVHLIVSCAGCGQQRFFQRFDVLHKLMIPAPMSYFHFKDSTSQLHLSVCCALNVKGLCWWHFGPHWFWFTSESVVFCYFFQYPSPI